MKPFDDAAYTMAAVSAVVALYRALVKNGVLTRDEAVRALLDEAVSRAIQAEAQQQGETAAAHDLNRQCAEILKFIAKMEKKYGLRCPNVFHAGDGNLHPLILFDANNPGELQRTELFAAEVLEKCVDVGGTITGEHGVGVEKINEMCLQFRPDELEAFLAVKHAFDPRGLLNPGKAVPTLARCAEHGRMRVRAGKLPHPELPRF